MQLTLEIPDEVAALLHEVEAQDDRALLVETVCGLYSRQRIGSGRAARLLGMTRADFQDELARRHIPLHYSIEDFRKDMAYAGGE